MVGAAITSCIVDKRSTLFYVGGGNFIHQLQASQEEERKDDDGRTYYNDSLLKAGKTEFKSSTKEISAISWQQYDRWRVRLYYADENNVLQGLNKEGNENWDTSDIGTLKIKIQPGSSITAVRSPDSDSTKVYYYKDGGDNKPWVAWLRVQDVWKTEKA